MEDSIRIRTYDGQYRIIGGDFQSMLAWVRQLPRRRYQSSERLWEIPQNITDIQKATEEAGFHVTADTEMGRALKPTTPQRGSADRILVRVGQQTLAVVGGSFRKMLDAVKAVEGRRFVSEAKLWELPGDVPAITSQMEERGYQVVTHQEAEGLPPAQAVATSDTPASPASIGPAADREDRIRVRVTDGEFWVTGRPFREMLDAIKALEGRRFVSAAKLWEVPITGEELHTAMSASELSLTQAEPERAATLDDGEPSPWGEAPEEPDEMPPFPFHGAPPPEEDDEFGF